MPILNGGSGDDMLRLAFQMIQQAQQRRFQQGQEQIATADSGATVGQVGMSPKQFAALFGKDTPFDAGRILKPQTSADVVDQKTRDWIKGLDPLATANLIATNMNNRAGIAGQTSMAGLESQREANTSKAKAEAVTAKTQIVTAENVAQMVEEGFNQLKTASPKTRAAMGQQAALGTTQDQAEQERLRAQLGAATMKEALDAQTDPTAPIHKFLAGINLNLPTVMAGTALGIQNLFDTYAHILVAGRSAGFDVNAAMEKAEIEHASDLAKNVFHGTLTPRQVRALMQSQEAGTKVPKGMEGASDLYGRSVSAYYSSAITKALTENDPYLQATAAQISALQKPGVDPNTLVAVQDLSSRAAGYAATLQQLGPQPDDPAGAAAWQQVFMSNVNRVPKGGIHFPWTTFKGDKAPGGLGAPNSPTPGAPAAPAPTSAPLGAKPPVPGVAPIAPVGTVPAAAGILKPVDTTAAAAAGAAMTDEQKASMAAYLKSIGLAP
jgi:hypothetical protein